MSDSGEIDDTIHCMFTLSDYTEDILGYGISYNKEDRKFSVADELISYEAYYEDKVRATATLKVPFTHWFPAFINLKHTSQGELDSLLPSKDSNSDSKESKESKDSNNQNNSNNINNIIAHNLHKTKWFRALSSSIKSLSEVLGEQYMSRQSHYLSLDENIWLKTLCKLINDMLVDLMRGDQHGSLVYFEALCSFWRTLYWYIHESDYSITQSKTAVLCDKNQMNNNNHNNNNKYGRDNNNNNRNINMPGQGHVQGCAKSLIDRLCERLQDFVIYEDSRHKDLEADLGHVMIIYSVMSDKTQFKIENMIEGYLFEANIRSVRWWKDKGVKENDIKAVFENTNVGRNLFVFQRLFLIDVVGMGEGRHNDRKVAFFNTYSQNNNDNNNSKGNDDNNANNNDNGNNIENKQNDQKDSTMDNSENNEENKGKRKRKRRSQRKSEQKEEDTEMKDNNESNESKENKDVESKNNEEISSAKTARRLDETNGKLGKYLELIQEDFKKSKELIDSTVKLWEFVGVSDEFMNFHSKREISEWIKLGVDLAKKKGSKYYPRRLLNAENGGGYDRSGSNNNNNKYNRKQNRREDYFISDVYGNNNNNNNNEYQDYQYNNRQRDGRNYNRYNSSHNNNYNNGYNNNGYGYGGNNNYGGYDNNRYGRNDGYGNNYYNYNDDRDESYDRRRHSRQARRDMNDHYGYGGQNDFYNNYSWGGNGNDNTW